MAHNDDNGDVQKTKNVMAGHQSYISRLYKETEKLMLSYDNKQLILQNKLSLDTAFENYTTSYNNFKKLLKNQQDIENASANFERQKQNKEEFNERIAEWLKGCETFIEENEKSESFSVSAKTSLSRTSSRSSARRLKEAKIKKEIAKLKMQQLQDVHKINAEKTRLAQNEESILAHNEYQQAELETRLWQAEVDEENKQELDPKAPPWTPQLNELQENNIANEHVVYSNKLQPVKTVKETDTQGEAFSQEITSAVQQAMVLPRPELLNFDGNPKDYHQFLHNFEANIETSIKCERLRLTYLIQQCSGKARESIQDCVVLPAKRGYLKAKEILRDRFGQPHLIARSYIRSLTEGQPVKGSTQLSDLAVKMTRCSLVLSQLSYNSDMNNSQNLLKIVRRLPMHLRGKWVDEADKILAKGREPIFSDLAKFIDNRARAANNMYGEDMNNVVEKKGVKNDKKFSSYKATTLATSENTGAAIRDSSKGSCKVCKGDHTVGHCKIFKDTDRNLRWSILKKCGLCANCLLSGHLARDCSKKPACATCNRKHHPLLHINF